MTKLSILATLASVLSIAPLHAETTPMDAAIPESKSTPVAVDFKTITVDFMGNKMELPGGEYHYQVFLPAGYDANKDRHYPVLFVTSPGGKANPAAYKERLEKDQIIGIGLTESQNGPIAPNMANFLSAHDDVMKRFRIADKFKFATGFSGGARAAMGNAGKKPGFAGVFMQGAGFSGAPAALQLNPGLCVTAVFGISDFNRDESASMVPVLTQNPHRISLAEGGHSGASKESFEEMFDFMEEATYVHRRLNDKPAMEQYKIRFDILIEQAKRAEGFDKYLAYESANKIALARKLTADPAFKSDKTLADNAAEAAKQVVELPKDKAIKDEIDARTAYYKIRDLEESKWPAVARDKNALSALTKQAAPAYEALSKKFPETTYGKKAAARAPWLTQGVQSEKKGEPEKKGD